MKSVILKALVLYHGRIIGTAAGIVLAFLLLHYGVLRTSFILVLSSLGYFLGSRIDSNEDLRSLLERLLPPLD